MARRKKGQGGPDREAAGQDLPDLRQERERLRRLIDRPAKRRPTALTVTGTLRVSEVEGRVIVLDSDDGTTYELRFPAGWRVTPDVGARVTVVGDLQTDVATTTQVGPVLRVRRLAPAD